MNNRSDGNSIWTEIGFESSPACIDFAPTSAGTFLLRRAHYFSELAMPWSKAEKGQRMTNSANEVAPETKYRS